MVSFTAQELAHPDPVTRQLRAEYNAAYTEYRKGVENAFGRVANWWPIFGADCKAWSHSTDLLHLAYHAAVRLHNWIMIVRNLDYDPSRDPSYLFTSMW